MTHPMRGTTPTSKEIYAALLSTVQPGWTKTKVKIYAPKRKRLHPKRKKSVT
jgi:hypothetical protein